MRRSLSFLFLLLAAMPAHAMQSGSPPMPKVAAPAGWPIIGYLIAGALFAGAIGLSLMGSSRADPDSGEVS
jgi:hypothetical protein